MTQSSVPRTIAVIPAYNEEAALPAVLRGLASELPELDVVVVDDGSIDATRDVASAAGVVCVRLPFNMGIGGALRAGFRYADEHGYDRAVQFDGDGQHRPDQVKLLLSSLDEGADMVVGNRFDSGRYDVGTGRRLAMGFLRLSVRMLTRQRFHDTSSGFRAIAQPLLRGFAAGYPVEYMDSVETLVAACRSGYRVVEIPIEMNQRSAGVPSTRSVRLAYHYARLAVALIGSTRRAIPARETLVADYSRD